MEYKMLIYNCLFCSKESTCGRSKRNLFCSTVCSSNQQKENSKLKLLNGEYLSPKTLKAAYISLRGEKCEVCSLENVWLNKKLILQLDHIDGDSDNNCLENLRLLCPNCHSQTETYGSKSGITRKNTKRNSYLQKYKNGQLAQ